MFNSTEDETLANALAPLLNPRRPHVSRLALLASIEAARQVLDDDARRLPFKPTGFHRVHLISKAVLDATDPRFTFDGSTPSSRAAYSAYTKFS